MLSANMEKRIGSINLAFLCLLCWSAEQVWSTGFPLGSHYETSSRGDKPEYAVIAKLHFGIQNLRFMCVSTDWPKGCCRCAEWDKRGGISHMQRCFSAPRCDRRIRLCTVHCGFTNPAALQNPNGNIKKICFFNTQRCWFGIYFHYFVAVFVILSCRSVTFPHVPVSLTGEVIQLFLG